MARGSPGTVSVAKPRGLIEEVGTGVVTNTTTYVELVSYTVTKDKRFHLAKIKVACLNAHLIVLKIGDTEYPPDIASDEQTFIDWFPWDAGLLGDGAKTIVIGAKAVLTPETLYGIIEGEED